MIQKNNLINEAAEAFKKGDIVFFEQEHTAKYSFGTFHFKLDEPYIIQEVFITDSVTIRCLRGNELHHIIDSYKLIKIRDYNLRKILNQ